MLTEETLFGKREKVVIAIDRIREFEQAALNLNEKGYQVCISGGKDSSVIQELAIMSGVKCEFIHNHTSVDYPETVYFVRNEKARIESLGYDFSISIPHADGRQKTMWTGILVHGLPTIRVRWCCKELKEYSGRNRFVITGVRWDESSKRRKNRGIFETNTKRKESKIVLTNDNDARRRGMELCMQKGSYILNPIIDWTNEEVWSFIVARNVPVNPLYAKGHKRVGCIGCPYASDHKKSLLEHPKYMEAYKRAAKKHFERIPTYKYSKYNTVEKIWNWWLNMNEKQSSLDEDCDLLFDFDDEAEES
jgi:phosphoadenosine phosphosulfate reductase